MFRRHWLEPRFWIWWWRWRLSPEFRTAAILGLFVLLLGAGWVAADQLSSANASGTNQDAVLETTVERTVTVHKLRAAAAPLRSEFAELKLLPTGFHFLNDWRL